MFMFLQIPSKLKVFCYDNYIDFSWYLHYYYFLVYLSMIDCV
jgi:hypothetical protein